MRRALVRSVVAASLLAASTPAPAVAGPSDPLGIAGSWTYETRSNCGPIGRGAVFFRQLSADTYEERGWVYWPHSRLTVRWWGVTRFNPATGHLRGWMDNSLGDRVDGEWVLEGRPAERLLVDWTQSNGCRGAGVASRPRGP